MLTSGGRRDPNDKPQKFLRAFNIETGKTVWEVPQEGPGDTWKVVRTMMGATNPKDSAPGTIRGDLGILFTENLIHGSDSAESAAREIELFFPGS